jgi:hypothetical protein
MSEAIDKVAAAVEDALADESPQEVLAFLIGSFVGLTVELARRNGANPSREIKIDGGKSRDIAIHAEKD